ncbi:MAG: hypothetical protein IJK23_05725 [Clostridia bacterium]|nr:hypothetical protein [Clostridia bacterium]
MKKISILIIAIAVLIFASVFAAASATTRMTPGDMNGDGKVNSADARAVLRIAARLEPLPDQVEVIATVAPSTTEKAEKEPSVTAPSSGTTSTMIIDPVIDVKFPELTTDITFDFGESSSLAVVISESQINSPTTPYTGDSINGHISLEDAFDMIPGGH